MIKTRRTKRTFSPELRLEAIEQVVKYQRDVREVALALELNPVVTPISRTYIFR